MSARVPEALHHDKPRPEDLAGTAACFEDDEPAVRMRGSRPPEAVRICDRTGGASGSHKANAKPTGDDPAGVPACAGESDDVTRPSIQPHQ